jgi:hemoglobin/transferrin/lactoferrin receptor protein
MTEGSKRSLSAPASHRVALAAWMAMFGGATVFAQTQTEAGKPAQAAPAKDGKDAKAKSEADRSAPAADDNKTKRFLDEVTVSATLNPASIKETPGTVSVVDAETIERRLVEDVSDLVKFEPGVYLESNLNRVGLNGFNIRGIGGNRVMTQIDGVETSEQFDFGPFNVHQFDLDLDTLKSAEIVRSAGSSLYGTDALGGVVSFFTKDPGDYLAGRDLHIGAKTTFDGRSDDASANFVIAGGKEKFQASLFAGFGYGHEPKNRGEIESQDPTRTALNPQDRRSSQGLAKLVFRPSDTNTIKASGEFADNDIDVEAYSSRTVTVAGPSRTAVTDIDSNDRMRRYRGSIDQTLVNRGGMDQWFWSAFAQSSTTDQVIDEVRATTTGASTSTINRSGTLNYEQKSLGGALQGRKAFGRDQRVWLTTFGASYKRHLFDMLRDRVDVNAATGAVVPQTALILPSKYFPKSDVGETGVYAQVEAKIGRLTIVPGIRYDRFTMDADEKDTVYLATLSPVPTDFDADAVSTRLGASIRVSEQLTAYAQYAAGFRAPPYSAINSGFTNLAGGYTSVSNPELRAETSDNFETGLRLVAGPVSFGVTGFWNSYESFIDQVLRGTNPTTRLLEYQYQNVYRVKIDGLELRGEARLAQTLRLRASYAVVRGNDVSGATDVPLGSVSPDQGVVGLEYARPNGAHGGELSVRSVRGQRQEVAGATGFAPGAFATFDATGWLSVAKVKVRAGLLNITNQKYFEWPNVRGRLASDTVIDRYSSPGFSAVASLSIGW